MSLRATSPLSSDGSLAAVLWLDFDTEPRTLLHAPMHWSFLLEHDVTHVPMRMQPHYAAGQHSPNFFLKPLSRLDDDTWVIDSGVLAVRTSAAAVQLLRTMMRHYDGGAVALARECLCKRVGAATTTLAAARPHDQAGSQRADAPCDKEWFTYNLYLDDLFVWTLFMQASGRAQLAAEQPKHAQNQSRAVSGEAGGWMPGGTPWVSQGWFASGRWETFWHNGTLRGMCTPTPLKRPPFSAFPCVGVAPHVSPFDSLSTVHHFISSNGAYTKTFKEKNMSQFPRYLKMPDEVLAAKEPLLQTKIATVRSSKTRPAAICDA